MLQYIKKYIKGWFLGIILFIIFLSFTFWGVGDIFRSGGNYVMKIGKTKILPQRFVNEFSNNIKIQNRNQENLNRTDLESIAYETVKNISNRQLILNASKKLNIDISDKVLKKEIYKNDLFQDKVDKKFDVNLYQSFVKRNFNTEENYLIYLKNQMIVELIADYFEKKIDYPNNLLKQIHNQLEEKKSFKIAFIDKEIEAKKLKIENNDLLMNYYNTNKEKYFFDERRSISYFFITTDLLKEKIEVNENELRKSYNDQKENFIIPEKRNVEQLFFNNEQEGLKALNLIKDDENFEKFSKEKDIQDMTYINLGKVEKAQLFEEFAEDVFQLKKNNFTNLIKSSIGFHILKVTEIKDEEVKKFKDVKDIIKKNLLEIKSFDELDVLINALDEELLNESSLEDIADKLEINLKQQKLIERKNLSKIDLNEFKNKKFYNEIFKKEKESNLFIEEIENGFFVIRIDEILDNELMSYEEAFNFLLKDKKKELINEQIKERVNNFKKEINEGNDFFNVSDSYEMSSRETKKINREEMVKQGIPLELVKKLYYSEKNSLHDFDTTNKFYIVKVLSESEIKYDGANFSNVKVNINKIYGIDNFNQLMVKLNKEFPTKINKEKINELIDRFQY